MQKHIHLNLPIFHGSILFNIIHEYVPHHFLTFNKMWQPSVHEIKNTEFLITKYIYKAFKIDYMINFCIQISAFAGHLSNHKSKLIFAK